MPPQIISGLIKSNIELGAFRRVYLQRRFEQERLPLLFAARSSKSALHRYTVTSPFEMTKKQAAHMPRLA